ncbi:hypothetical protein GC173_04900 [bacterium]|nr:hypothetical protein [bacterium]
MASEDGDTGLLKVLVFCVVLFFFSMFQTFEEYDYWTKGQTVPAKVTDIREYRSRRSSGYEVYYSYPLQDRSWTGSFRISRESLSHYQSLPGFEVEAIPGEKTPRSRIKGENSMWAVYVFALSVITMVGFLIKMQFFSKGSGKR